MNTKQKRNLLSQFEDYETVFFIRNNNYELPITAKDVREYLPKQCHNLPLDECKILFDV